MLREYRVDLHIHTCLSPCASLDLSPRRIVERALAEGLNLIAVTDHNTAANVPPVARIGEAVGLKVIPGMEVQTREEIHLLALFPEEEAALRWGEEAYAYLPDVKNKPDIFGDQPVVDAAGDILRFEERLLLNSLNLSLEEVMRRVEEKGGLIIPSHFDKGSFSLISQLGMIPPHLKLEGLEMSRRTEMHPPGPSPPAVPRILSSDAHSPEEIGGAYTVFLLQEPSLQELRLALGGREGRRIARKMDRGVIVL